MPCRTSRYFRQPLLLTPPSFASGLGLGKPASFPSLVPVPSVEAGLRPPWTAASAVAEHQPCAGRPPHLQGLLISLNPQKTAPEECLSLPVPCAGGGAETQRWQSQGRNPDPSGPSQAPEHGPRSWVQTLSGGLAERTPSAPLDPSPWGYFAQAGDPRACGFFQME